MRYKIVKIWKWFETGETQTSLPWFHYQFNILLLTENSVKIKFSITNFIKFYLHCSSALNQSVGFRGASPGQIGFEMLSFPKQTAVPFGEGCPPTECIS